MQPKVSVSIAVYNTEPYLRRCLDSVCRQSLRNIEILCVNDGSTDISLEILREYASNDSRVNIIDFSHNQGAASAHNASIAIARGEYLGIVDSDDVIDLDFYEKLYAKAQRTDSLIVKGVRRQISIDGNAVDEILQDDVRLNKFAFTCQWTTAIYQTDFIRKNSINCPLNALNGEDIAFLTKVVCLAQKIETVDDAIYWYMRRVDSTSSKILSFEKICAVLAGLEDAIFFINRHMPPQEEYDALFWNCILNCEKLLHRTRPDDHKTPVACAETALRMYSLYPYTISPQKENKILIQHLNTGDVATLTDYFRKDIVKKKRKKAAHLRSHLHNLTEDQEPLCHKKG